MKTKTETFTPVVKDAGSIEPHSIIAWIVISKTHEHLKFGDTVWMVEDPDSNNWLIDYRKNLYRLTDTHGNYIMLQQKIL